MKIYLLQMLMAAKRLYRRIANIYLARRARPAHQESRGLFSGSWDWLPSHSFVDLVQVGFLKGKGGGRLGEGDERRHCL